METLKLREKFCKAAKTVVVKVGTSLLTDAHGRLSRTSVLHIAHDIAGAQALGHRVALVTSGAIGAGLAQMGLKERPKEMPMLQAAAAVGQGVLMHEYFNAFREAGLLSGQILLTNEDFKRDGGRDKNIRNTMLTLIKRGIVPVVNENDTVSTEEIRVGDNDRLSALLTLQLDADLLVLLSDVEGLLRTDGAGAKSRVHLVETVNASVESHVWSGGSVQGTGGMKTKLLAARTVTEAGKAMVIADGRVEGVLGKILCAQNIGTLFLPKGVYIR